MLERKRNINNVSAPCMQRECKQARQPQKRDLFAVACRRWQAVAGGGSGWMRCECADANSESETRRCGHHTTVAAVVQTWTRERGMGAGLLYRLER
jgi:hypothetical protein